MRWRVRVNRGPRIGDVRIRKVFAFFPVQIGYFRVWLESYYRVERCFHVYGILGGKWAGESRFFDQASAEDHVKENYERFVFLKLRNLYRDMSGTGGRSPWYQDPAS